MTYPFVVCDVFTEQQFGGNPLAVITNATGLSSEQMQKIAREFNYSETTFVLPPQRGGDYQIRIFTASTEFPFAGHPNIGTAIVLADQGLLPSNGRFIFEEIAGDVPVTVVKNNAQQWRAELRAPEALSIGNTFNTQLIADVLSLNIEDILTSYHKPMAASVGLPFIMVELRNMLALQQAKVNNLVLETLIQQTASPFLHLYVRQPMSNNICCRMFAPTDGVPEDPATGRLGESFYAFLPRTVFGGFNSAWEFEAGRMKKQNLPVWSTRN